MSETKGVYFPNLNGLRFIAALMVIISHVELNKWKLGLPHFFDLPFMPLLGRLGVILFFVLSGFLITYLLLHEKQETHKVSVRNFYIRRILRIWPLYFLIMILGVFVYPAINYLEYPVWSEALHHNLGLKVLLMIFFLPNLVYVVYAPIPYVAQTWSIGVEEQFYLIWPVLAKYSKKIFRILLMVIFLYLALKFLILTWSYYRGDLISDIMFKFWDLFCIDCMAIGGMMAYFLIEKKSRILKMLYHPLLQWISYASVLIFIVTGFRPMYIYHELYAVFFAVIILNMASNPYSIVNLEYRSFSYLGKISYGIYMFHPIVTFAVIKTAVVFHLTSNVLYYAATILITILLSAVSYEWFEKRFLKAKIRFSSVISGDNVDVVKNDILPINSGK